MSDALINGLAGAGGGIIAQLITYPLQTVNTRQQTDRDPKKRTNKAGTVEQMLQVVQQEGWGRLYSGLAPSLVGTACSQVQKSLGEVESWDSGKSFFPTLVSNPSIQFMLYETLLKKLKQRRALSNSNKGIFLLGALAKLGATVVTYPLLVVKSRLQARQAIGLDKKHQYEGTLDAILKMIRYEGLHGFYKGMSTKIVQSVLAAAVLFMVKEELVNGVRWMLLKDAAKVVKFKSP
ncbi:peroxisomal nicotinamide adenine dinucleotide carrier [Tanacetum coccineum]